MTSERAESRTAVGRWARGACWLLGFTLGSTMAEASTVEWVWTDKCVARGSTNKISCGGYGEFFVFDSDVPAGCLRKGSGVDDPHHYAQPFEGQEFPPLPGEEPSPVIPAQRRLSSSPERVPGRLPSDPPWISVIDFDTTHGGSVWWLAQEIADGQAVAELSFIDDEALLDMLGESVGDFHLLASLCAVVEEVDDQGRTPPAVVNLSLGRAVAAGEELESKSCNPDRILCQIAGVVDHLGDRGTHVLAAAGNHAQDLIPGALDNVATAGSLDLTHLLKRLETVPSWESPPGALAFFPANGLCLRGGFPAAGGSSYASAIFAGWLANALALNPNVRPLDGRTWAPHWSEGEGCFVLGADAEAQSLCNRGFDEIIEELSASGVENCWTGTGESEILVAGPLPLPGQLPAWPTYDEWLEVNHPTPESDPCIPCTGWPPPGASPGGGDIVVNLARSYRLPDDQHLHHVYLRVDDAFYTLGLEGSVDALEEGTVDYLILAGWAGVVDFDTAASLVYVMSESDSDDCGPGGSGECYWSATQILWRPEP